jgi:ABC-type transport system involved in multi-copper enzyme maturation permease subunit
MTEAQQRHRGPSQDTPAAHRATPAEVSSPAVSPLSVAGWELRRLGAARSRLLLMAALFVVFTALVWVKNSWQIPVNDAAHQSITIYGTSRYGAIWQITGVLLLFYGIVLPFLATDAVAGDRQARTHEMLMATSIRGWAYVTGRYLAAILTALFTAVLLLAALFIGGTVVHAQQAGAPPPSFTAALVPWALIVLPAAVLLTSVSFALGTLAPKLATAAKALVLLIWIALDVVTDIGHGLGWFGYWTPTSTGILKVLPAQLAAAYHSQAAAHPALAAQQASPHLTPWVGPHLGLIAIGGLAAGTAAVRFRRFRNALT